MTVQRLTTQLSRTLTMCLFLNTDCVWLILTWHGQACVPTDKPSWLYMCQFLRWPARTIYSQHKNHHSAKPLHNHDIVSVHFIHFYCMENCDKLSRLSYVNLHIFQCNYRPSGMIHVSNQRCSILCGAVFYGKGWCKINVTIKRCHN